MRMAGAVAAMSNPSRAFTITSPNASRAFSGDQKIGSQPSAISNACATAFGPHHREIDRDVRTQRAGHQLQRLAEPGAVRDRDVVVRAVVLDELAAQRCANDLDVLARLLERLSPRLAVPALDDLWPRRPETEQEAAAGQEVERGRRHRRVRRRAAGDLHDRRAELDPLGRRPEPGEDGHAVRSPCLRGPGGVVAESLRLLRHRDRLERARAGRRVPHVEAELHAVRC